ncbi:MAG TPA: hypothetical protein VLM80_05325 [Anaerolineales bacterium]|nr:hypothetical protein [Anaerolineales bacterium]
MKQPITNQYYFLFLIVILATNLSACSMEKPFTVSQAYGKDVESSAISVPPVAFFPGGQFSGDDAFGPAAIDTTKVSIPNAGLSFSGDDAYDPAAALELPIQTGDHRNAPAIRSFSGDDSYDPASGGLGK